MGIDWASSSSSYIYISSVFRLEGTSETQACEALFTEILQELLRHLPEGDGVVSGWDRLPDER